MLELGFDLFILFLVGVERMADLGRRAERRLYVIAPRALRMSASDVRDAANADANARYLTAKTLNAPVGVSEFPESMCSTRLRPICFAR